MAIAPFSLAVAFSVSLFALVLSVNVAPSSPTKSRVAKWLAYLVVLVALVLVATTHLSQKRDRGSQSTQKLTLVSSPDVSRLELLLLNSAKVSRPFGDPHVIGVFGNEEYSYTGRIRVAGAEYDFSSERLEPVAALQLGDDVYVLCRGYFSRNAFRFQKATENGEFEEVTAVCLPTELRYLRFANDNDAFFYKFWWLNELIKTGALDETAACLQAYVNENPRFAFRSDWAEQGGRETVCADFFDRIEDPELHTEFYDSLTTMTRHSDATDDPQALRFVCLSLISLKPIEGKQFLNEFKRQVRRAGITADHRLEALEPIDLGPSTVTESPDGL